MKRKKRHLFFILLAVYLAAGCFVGSIQAEKKGPIQNLINTLEVGKALSYKNLTIIPVYSTKLRDRTKYTTLDEAFKNKWVEVTEVDGGQVPRVKITNLSKRTIYMMGGEILTGCKQDRILAQDVLLAPGTKNLLVPVYCVEHGRWTRNTSTFYSKKNIGTYKLRSRAQAKAPAAQSKIWEQIDKQNRDMGVVSGTSAYQDAYEKEENKASIAEIERKMQRVPRLYDDTIGVVIGLGNRIVSMDIFANPYLFKKQWPKILKSSALSSITNVKRGNITQHDAANFLKSLFGKDYERKPALDLGYELSVNDSDVNVNALVYKEKNIHMAGFPREDEKIGIKKSQNQDQRLRVIRQPLIQQSANASSIR
jgi:hypothetical protein